MSLECDQEPQLPGASYLCSEGESDGKVGGGGGPGPGDGVSPRPVAQDGAPQLHRLAQGGAEVLLLPAVEDGREVGQVRAGPGSDLLQSHLPVPDCREIVYCSVYLKLSPFQIIFGSHLMIGSLTQPYSDQYHGPMLVLEYEGIQ